MSNVKKSAGEYSAKITEKLNSNNDKILLVDYSKSCAVKTLTDVLSHKDSQLFLVENRRIARDLLTLLEPTLGTFTLIDTVDTLAACLKNAEMDIKGTQASFISKAQALKNRYPRVMFTFRDENSEADLFHAALCKDGTRNGVYDGLKIEDYCISFFPFSI